MEGEANAVNEAKKLGYSVIAIGSVAFVAVNVAWALIRRATIR